MANPFFKFKQFTIYHDRCAMKVTTDACLFGAWCAEEIRNENLRKWDTALDIGTGTGLLSLMIAQKNNLAIDAVEIDQEAAEQAKENVLASPWSNKVCIHHNDVLALNREKKYDIIISNPPFYEKEIKSIHPAKNIAHHSHVLKVEDLLFFIKDQLVSNGSFFLLLPHKRLTEIESLFKKVELYIEQKVLVKQSVHHQPFRIMIKGRPEAVPTSNHELSIKNEQDEYTSEFVQLLKDYYLYL